MLRQYARDHFAFEPFDVIELNMPEAGLTGVAYVLPVPTSPVTRAGHRVYLKRMLLTESAEGLLPDWAFFARCVIDATELRPTASREALYEACSNRSGSRWVTSFAGGFGGWPPLIRTG